MTSEKTEHISNEEPKLFEEKEPRKGLGKGKLAILIFVLVAGFFLWPRGVMKGEAILQAGKFAKLGLTSSGVLKELLHEKGERVKVGALIARFENQELLKLSSQQALLLDRLRERKALLQEKASFYEKEKERSRILYENSVIGSALLEKASLEATGASKELLLLEKEIDSAQKESDYLISRVEALELKAPFDGILLTDPSDHVGSPIKEGEFVLEIADPDTYFLEYLVPEKDVEKISVGDKVKARFRAFPWKNYAGEVARIAPRITEEIEKVFKIRYVIPCEIKLLETPANLKYGMRAQIRIQTRRKGAQSR